MYFIYAPIDHTMSPAILIKPPPTLNHRFHSFLPLKESATLHRNSIRFKKASMATESTETIYGDHDDKCITPVISAFKQIITNDCVSYDHQPARDLHTLANHLSKWVVAVSLSGLIMLRHDPLALWAATGSVSNFALSLALKRVLKQERPVSDVGSGPGMPSSHAQSIFFILVFAIMSVIEWMGTNGATIIFGVLLVALGLYFAWLRVLLGYHTTSQVIVGQIVGLTFAVLWFWAWEAIVHGAYNSYLWVQMMLLLGVACY